MKHKIKSSILSLATLGLCVNAVAAVDDEYAYSDYYDSVADEATEPMTVPVGQQGFRASVAYLLGQPTYNNGFVNNFEGGFPTAFGRTRPAFTQSGIAASLAFDFDNGKFVQADWMNFFGNTQSSNGNLVKDGVIRNGEAPNVGWDQLSGQTRSTFMRLATDVGQTFYAGDNLLYRLSFGAQYARIGVTENSLANGFEEIDTVIVPEDQRLLFGRKSTFNGIGPRIGLGAEYDIGWNLKLVGQTYASLNVGNIKTTTTNDLGEEPVHATDSFRTVVPGLEGNLGIRYDYGLGSGDLGIVSTELGYQAIGYFNTVSGTRDAFSTNPTDATSINSPSSYGNQAVYIKFAYKGNTPT